MYDIGEQLRQKIDDAVREAIRWQAVRAAGRRGRRRLLVTSRCVRDGHVVDGHPSIGAGSYAIARLGEASGCYTAFFCDEESMLDADTLSRFDGICFNNTFGVLTEDPERRRSLLDFVRRGGGFVGLHAAAATFCQYPRYDQFPDFGRMLGGYENGGHPWGPEETIVLVPEDAASPINAPFNGREFAVQDEVFQMREHYSRDRLRVLLRIDVDRTDFGPGRRVLPERRADRDLAISWIRTEGKGMVFYSSLGHNPHIFWNASILGHVLAGVRYTLGDLEADATPRPLPA